MTIQYASDLHLEMTDNKYFLQDEPLQPVGDLLLLAGDIAPFRFIKEYDWFFDYISNNFKTTYWIPGNHEYYHYDLASKCGSFNEAIRDNIFLVNDYAVTVENARMIFPLCGPASGQGTRSP
jgi:predicted phosphohydrolase